jgi:hypothetical protein
MKIESEFQPPPEIKKEPLRRFVIDTRITAAQKRQYLKAAAGQPLFQWAIDALDAVAGRPAPVADLSGATVLELEEELDRRAAQRLQGVVEKLNK